MKEGWAERVARLGMDIDAEDDAIQSNKTVVVDALDGNRGLDQFRIAKEGIAWVSLLLRKNADYDSSAWKRPVLAPECDTDTAMRVRMSDKIERITSLLSKGDPEVVDESIRDTVRDLGAYCLLWLACPQEGNP